VNEFVEATSDRIREVADRRHKRYTNALMRAYNTGASLPETFMAVADEEIAAAYDAGYEAGANWIQEW